MIKKIENIVLSHKAERDELLKARYVQREGIHNARKSIKNNLIKVIVGPRRAGKSVFAIQMLEGLDFAYLNFDDESSSRAGCARQLLVGAAHPTSDSCDRHKKGSFSIMFFSF